MLGSILGCGLLHRKPNVSLRPCVGLTALGKVLRTLEKSTL